MKFRTTVQYKIILASFLAFGAYTVGNQIASAETSQELTEQKASVDNQVEKLNTEVSDLQAKLQKEVESFNKTNEELKQKTEDIAAAETRIENRTVVIGKRIVAYQSNDSNLSLYIDAIFGSNSISEAMSRVSSVKTILDADKSLIEEQEQDKASLEKQQKALAELKKDQQVRFQQMQQQEEELQIVIAENKAKSLALQAQIADAKEQEALEAERLAAEEEAKKLASLQTNVTKGKAEGQKAVAATTVQSGTSGAIAEAKKYIGMPYAWGGSNPSTSFDCSGLVQWSYGKAGISLPRTAAEQYLATSKISAAEAQAGDLVFFSYGSGVAHVGIYLGNGQMLDAQNDGVVIESLDWWQKYIVGYGRV